MLALCPLCGFGDFTVEDRTDDGVVFITCSHPSHTEPYVLGAAAGATQHEVW